MAVSLRTLRWPSLNLVRVSSGWTTARKVLQNELNSIKEAGTWKSERVITTPQAASIKVEGDDRSILNFCANNYLGLSVCPLILHN